MHRVLEICGVVQDWLAAASMHGNQGLLNPSQPHAASGLVEVLNPIKGRKSGAIMRAVERRLDGIVFG
jgi:hypothetical protein